MPSLQTRSSHHARRSSPAFVLDNHALCISAVIPSPVPLLHWFVLKILRHQIQLPPARSRSSLPPLFPRSHCDGFLLLAYRAILLSLLLCRLLLRSPNDPVFPFDTPLLVTLSDPSALFRYLTGNPFFCQPFCGMWVTKKLHLLSASA